ncbi:histidine kinase dimerization/phosphoacceptor domain -containing protein [Phenylobacterium sp.]|jgi:PAS domain S-box-containing protein|uniref:histidine kinase dimerization/phosphoacceptor domain -containing protein n=1 Tax=Phenylobacterium sp. TaxID=1871053 RepID=UPI002F95D6FF
MNNQYQTDMPDTADRTRAGRYVDAVEQQGGLFVEAVRRTRMPMLVTDATLPGNPITFANPAFTELSGYSLEELLGQDPHFMNGAGTDPEAIAQYTEAMDERRDCTLEIVQYRKDGSAFRAMLFASPVDDGQGVITSHFLSYLDITGRWEAEEGLRILTSELESRVADRTAALEAANARLTELLAERDLLMTEVNHRAKNSLTVATGLLAVQGRRQSDPAVRAEFEAAQERLHAMAKVHDLLSKSETGQRVDLATYLAQLCDALGGIADRGRVRVRAEADAGILLDADTAFPVGIILTELITNALKYAFPDGRAGLVLAQAQRTGAGQVELLVRDDGVGMGQLREGSLGYGLVRSLVTQIGGVLTIETAPGVTVRITFQNTAG